MMNTTVTTQVQIMEKILKVQVICTTITIIGIIIAVLVKSMNFDVVHEECLFAYQILGYVMGE